MPTVIFFSSPSPPPTYTSLGDFPNSTWNLCSQRASLEHCQYHYETYKTSILVKYTRNKSFQRAGTKKAIRTRGWLPHNRNIIIYNYIMATMTAYIHFRGIEYDVFISPHFHTPDISDITDENSPTYYTWFLQKHSNQTFEECFKGKTVWLFGLGKDIHSIKTYIYRFIYVMKRWFWYK